MRIGYLEIVTADVDAVCASYAAATGVQFCDGVAALGNARTAPATDGGLIGVRASMHETEKPVIRPYWLVDEVDAAVLAAEKAGGEIIHPAMTLPGQGRFAIYRQGENEHGLWQHINDADV
ncbi:MAG: VOC family protein [Gammaproteobacteria bacterium]